MNGLRNFENMKRNNIFEERPANLHCTMIVDRDHYFWRQHNMHVQPGEMYSVCVQFSDVVQTCRRADGHSTTSGAKF